MSAPAATNCVSEARRYPPTNTITKNMISLSLINVMDSCWLSSLALNHFTGHLPACRRLPSGQVLILGLMTCRQGSGVTWQKGGHK